MAFSPSSRAQPNSQMWNHLTLFVVATTLVLSVGQAADIEGCLDCGSDGSPGQVIRTLTPFATGAWLENIAIRSNGDLLITRLDVPELWTISPNYAAKPRRLVRLSNATALLGITEVERDVFVFTGGNVSLSSGQAKAGSWGIWTVDLHRRDAVLRKAVSVPGVQLLNGLTHLGDRFVLGADSSAGAIVGISLKSGSSRVLVSGKRFSAPDPTVLPIGVNGVKVNLVDRAMYFTNTGAGTLGRAFMNSSVEIETIVTGLPGPDDFVLAPWNSTRLAFVALSGVSGIARVDLRDKSWKVIAKGPELQRVTALAFGRTRGDERTLYAVTAGARDAMNRALGPAKVLEIPFIA